MKHLMKRLIPLLLVLALIVSVCWYVLVYDRETIKDLLMVQAQSFTQNGYFEAAAWCYDTAYYFAENTGHVAIDLASLYRDSGNYTKAEYTLVSAIANGATAELYAELCRTYVEQDKLLDAGRLLDQVTDPGIKNQLDAQRPPAPEADYIPGFYSQYISLTFARTQGSLYVTTDGSFPSTADAPCTAPVTLEAGETTVYALTVGETGLVSPVVMLNYTIGGVVEELEFADVYLEELLREKLLVSDGAAIYTDDLWTITELEVPEDVIELSDLQYMTYLEKLTIQDRKLEDLSFLSAMPRLRELNLDGCTITGDRELLGTLPALETLSMNRCAISSLAFLQNAPALKELHLGSNALGNLTMLTTIPTLEKLDLSDNAVSDLTPLQQLPKLTELNVSQNLLVTINPLAVCTGLTVLDVSDNKLTAIDTVSSLTALTSFKAAKNSLVNAAPLAQCLDLQILDLSNNKLSDITALSALTKLSEFYFSRNTVTTLPAWPATAGLVIIDGSYNRISSLSQLDKLEAVNYIYMDYNEKLEKIGFLADNPNLVQINVYGTKVTEAQANRCLDRSIIVHYDPT